MPTAIAQSSVPRPRPWTSELLLLLLRQDAAQMGPLWRGEGAEEKSEGGRARCAPVRCVHTDVHSANPVAPSRTWRAGCPEGAPPGCVSFGDFSLHKQRKVTRSTEGRVEALHLQRRSRWIPACAGMTSKKRVGFGLRRNDVKRKELDYARLLSRALRAMTSSAVESRYANVRYGILPSQSGFRRNDEQGWRPLAKAQRLRQQPNLVLVAA